MKATRRNACTLAAVAAMLAAGGCATTEVPAAYVESCHPVDQPRRTCIQSAPLSAKALSVSGEKKARIDAQCRWNRSGVLLQPGASYELKVTAMIEAWRDKTVDADVATGWTGSLSWLGAIAQRWARDTSAPMYALVGAQGQRPETFVAVGKSYRLRASTADELLLFANDWPSRYQNNHGCLELTIKRLE